MSQVCEAHLSKPGNPSILPFLLPLSIVVRLTKTVLTHKITRNRIVPSFKDSPRKQLRRPGDLLSLSPVSFATVLADV